MQKQNEIFVLFPLYWLIVEAGLLVEATVVNSDTFNPNFVNGAALIFQLFCTARTPRIIWMSPEMLKLVQIIRVHDKLNYTSEMTN